MILHDLIQKCSLLLKEHLDYSVKLQSSRCKHFTNQELPFFRANAVEESHLIRNQWEIILIGTPMAERFKPSAPAHVVLFAHPPSLSPRLLPPGRVMRIRISEATAKWSVTTSLLFCTSQNAVQLRLQTESKAIAILLGLAPAKASGHSLKKELVIKFQMWRFYSAC